MMTRPLIYTMLILHYSLSVISAKLSPCARWNKTGITVVGTGKRGNAPDQLDSPQTIFIHKRTNTLYVADCGNKRIQMIPLDHLPNRNTTVIFTKDDCSKVYVADDNDRPTTYVSLLGSESVKKWFENASSGIQVAEAGHYCLGLSVDKENNVYMADYNEHCVFKWSPQTNTTTIVAGQKGEQGTTDRVFTHPAGIYVDQNTGAVYVADFHNNRIQKWARDTAKGITVGGSSDGMWGHDNASLYLPRAVVVDDETQIVYVADTGNFRIQRWLSGALEGETIAGDFEQGYDAHHLASPLDLAFDNDGNLYVCDTGNDRVQMFKMIDNEPCPEMSTAPSSKTTSTVTTTTIKSHAILLNWNPDLQATLIIATLLLIT